VIFNIIPESDFIIKQYLSYLCVGFDLVT